MSDDRRYKQQGYKDFEDGSQQRGPANTGAQRSRVITAYKETVRCDQCGADLSTAFEVQKESLCPKCQEPLHTCRNCLHFDPSSRWQCTQPIKERIMKKSGANTCDFFMVRTISVKDIGPSAPTRSEDARKALEDLFKK